MQPRKRNDIFIEGPEILALFLESADTIECVSSPIERNGFLQNIVRGLGICNIQEGLKGLDASVALSCGYDIGKIGQNNLRKPHGVPMERKKRKRK